MFKRVAARLVDWYSKRLMARHPCDVCHGRTTHAWWVEGPEGHFLYVTACDEHADTMRDYAAAWIRQRIGT